MIDVSKYGFEQNGSNTEEWKNADGFILYAGIGNSLDGSPDVELLTLQFMLDCYEFRGTHEEMDYYLKTKFRETKLNDILEDE